MTYDDAVLEAQMQADATGDPMDVWEHVGGHGQAPTGRFLVRASALPPPKFGRWTKRDTVVSAGVAAESRDAGGALLIEGQTVSVRAVVRRAQGGVVVVTLPDAPDAKASFTLPSDRVRSVYEPDLPMPRKNADG